MPRTDAQTDAQTDARTDARVASQPWAMGNNPFGVADVEP